ncbi:uncharacterized protein LOC142341668 [Convolutriloba macropyga]|uniref:uncharacterized protein LOC142341668 n=1 Tax=Convolutriloba macropyga TaxID=536237 RepID=UPI003F5213E9
MSGTSVPDLVPGCDSSSSPVPIDISSLSSSSSHISTNGHQTEHEIPTQNGHAQDSRSTNGYFLQTPPSNYCQNGTTNNSEYDGVNARSQNLINSFMLSQSANSNGTCPIADSAITTTPCSLNFCAHCSRASPNHLNGRVTEGLTVQSYRPISNHQALSTSQANGDGSILSNGVSENGELRKTANNHPGSSHSSRKPSQCSCDWVDLNVGGRIFKTTRLTLSKVPGSFLDCLCNNQNLLSSHVDQNGAILIDREPEYWAPVLNWLRCGKLILNDGVSLEGVLEEASFCGLAPLVSLLKDRIRFRDNNTLGHSHVYRILQCKEKELTQTVSTLTDGWKFEQLVNTGTSYRYGDEDQSEFLCVVSKRKQGQKSDDLLDQQAQNWQNRQNNLGRGASQFSRT